MAGMSRRRAVEWIGRYRRGDHELVGRSSRPHGSPRRTLPPVVERVIALRRKRQTGLEIARQVGISPATVARILADAGLSRLHNLEPIEPVRRYEKERPAEMVHLDTKKLGRIGRIGIGSRATADRAFGVSAGSSFMWPSTITLVAATSKSSQTKELPPPSASWIVPRPGLFRKEFEWRRCLPTTAATIAQKSSPPPVTRPRCVIAARALIDPAPTARRNDSSKLFCEMGLQTALHDLLPTHQTTGNLRALLQSATTPCQP